MLLQSNDKNRIVLSYAGMETRAQRNGGKARTQIGLWSGGADIQALAKLNHKQ